MRKLKVLSYSFYGALLLFLSVIILELYLLLNNEEVHLYQEKYYGSTLDADPYERFVVQHLHPYYLFSLPWKEEDRNLVNNKIVSVDNDGFRNGYGYGEKKAVLLGGSTAFGHFSTNNDTTIGAFLGRLGRLSVVNRNAPSWNSHQEATALFKYHSLEDVDVSISLSLNNDMSIMCLERDFNNSDEALDFPESWIKVSALVDDIRGDAKETDKNTFKLFLRGVFPNAYRYLASLDNNISNKEAVSSKVFGDCALNDADKVANSFLSNQKLMSKVADAYGFKHLLFIQPMHITHKRVSIAEGRTKEEQNFKLQVIKKIMESEYCKHNICRDFSNLFDDSGLFLEQYVHISENSLLRERWFNSGIFVDNGHFNDKGNEIVAEHIKQVMDNL